MPMMLEKHELLKSVVETSPFDKFWLDTIRPLKSRALMSFPDSILGCDVQVIYIPVAKHNAQTSAKKRLHALMARTPKKTGEPYSFHREDAYDEELA